MPDSNSGDDAESTPGIGRASRLSAANSVGLSRGGSPDGAAGGSVLGGSAGGVSAVADLPGEAPDAGVAEDRAADDLDEVERPAGDQGGFRLAAFGALLIVVLFAGYGLGRLNNGASAPPAAGGATTGAMPGMVMDESRPHTHASGGAPMPAGAVVGGLSLSSGGLTLVPTPTDFVAGRRQRLTFRIAGAGGAPVTTYLTVHEKPLHLVVIRRDLTGFQHLHPTMAADGTWGIDLTLAEPGIYRMIADFTAIVGGQQVVATLGGDLTAAGDYSPRALPAPVQTVTAEGFTVTYAGAASTASTQPIMVGVAGPDGRPATLEPYLGAFGHLVVMRQGDLAYVHVHPEAQLVDGKVKFWVAMPSTGTYRMFFDFQVAGKVHTAAWTTVVG